ncbi:hypothetical protein FSP39_017790 [Pinctada imbricata]|uniref:Calponin-homology (CH) domain-containing protein n=1 Tax=Pinctada imbricata TaxID=66713 RepID=A0AA89BYX7_PINIB|nr:hypothetical protein FSP39_017790 [Pinctada imbricata]
MATTFNSGGQSTSHQRPIERVLEDAQYTGEINLSGRKLREYPKLSTKYDLADTNLSKNRLGEVPTEICEYRSLDRLNCYHNVIKILPEALTQLQNLTHLCISRNQLTVIPSFIKQLHALEVLIASHNRIVSLPEEIGELKRLMEIDVSCNEISHLPVQIGDLKSLRSLNVRRNLLVELPLEISKLHLRKLDFASNKIAVIPTIFRKLETLEEFILDHNPLTLPPAFVCTKGKQHIMKYLQIEAIKEDRKRGILNDTEMKRLVRKSLPPQNSISSEEFRNMIDNTSPENKWKRHTVLSSDSGYSTTDSIEKCGVWSPSEASDMDDRMTNKMANMVREPHQKPDPARRILDSRPPPINTACTEGIAVQQNNHLSPKTPTPGQYSDHIQYSDHTQYSEPNNHVTHLSSSSSPLSPQTPVTPKFFIDKSPNDDEFTRELQRQKSDYERKKKQAEQIRLQQEEEDKENRRLAAQRVQEAQQAEIAKQREELRLQEEARIREEERSKEEARRLEEERLREEARIAEEQRQKEDAKRQAESNQHYHYQGWQTSERYSPGYTSSSHAPSNHFSPAASSTLSPTYGGHQVTSRGYPPSHHGYPPAHVSRRHIIIIMYYRNPVQSSQSFNSEDKKPSNSTQYRRTASDSVKKSTNVATSRSNQAKHGTMNGKSPSSPGISPSPSPRSSVGSTGPSPASSTSSLHKTGVNTTSVVRRTKVTDRVATAPSSRTTPGSERHGRAATGSSTGAPSSARTPTTNSTSGPGRKNHLTPEEEYRQKHPGMRSGQPASNDRPPVGRLEDSRLKSTQKDTVNNFVTRKPALSEEERKRSLTSTARTTNYNNRRSGGVMSSSSTMKVIDSYKDSESNYTLRRQEEKLKEEADQLDRLRKTIESKLKVTLPDNLPETLRDGVLLCQLANSIRPRAVTSIHVPSPAVPKLTMAKCRKNVENFLEACRKIGVQRDHLCTCEDITDNLRLNRVANTVQQLALCPRLTPKDFHEQMCGAQDILEEKGISRVAVTIATLVSMQSGPRGSNV